MRSENQLNIQKDNITENILFTNKESKNIINIKK